MSLANNIVPREKARSSCADQHDELGWTHGRTFRLNKDEDSVSLGIRTNDGDLLERLIELMPSTVATSDVGEVDALLSVRLGGEVGKGRRDFHILYDGCTQIERTLDLDWLVDRFRLYAVRAAAEAIFKESVLLFHGVSYKVEGGAAAVFDRMDRLSVLRSALASAGLEPLSTGVIVLNNSGWVRPMPLAEDDGAVLVEEHQDVEQELPLKKAILLDDEATEATALSPAMAAMKLLPAAGGNPVMLGRMRILSMSLTPAEVVLYPRASFDRDPAQALS